MPSCPSITSFSLSLNGQRELRDIQEILKVSQWLQTLLVGGSLLNALANDRVIPSVFSITTTDWALLGKAVSGVPIIAQNRIEQISGLMALRTRGKEHEFWQAMYDLCMFNN